VKAGFVYGALVLAGVGLAAESSLRWGPSNLDAMLNVIKEGESNGDYSALVGGGRFNSFLDHPANMGWKGTILGDGGRSTAAGAYQIILGTWEGLRDNGIVLPDFSPENQDKAAIALIEEKGAMQAVDNGNISMAIRLLAPVWDIFNKPKWDYDYTLARFLHYGGSQNVDHF
jgi:muramidase (phage lysozyme)